MSKKSFECCQSPEDSARKDRVWVHLLHLAEFSPLSFHPGLLAQRIFWTETPFIPNFE